MSILKRILLHEVATPLFKKLPKMSQKDKDKIIEEKRLIKSSCKHCKKETYELSTVTITKCLDCGKDKE